MNTLLSDTSEVSLKRVSMLASPYIPWGWWDVRSLVRAWVETASAIPKEKEVASSIVDALLQIVCFELPPTGNHGDIWSWLTLRPSLPPICRGRCVGSHPDVMQQVRGLKNIEILKSYLLVVWSEWDSLRYSGFLMMCKCICEEFSGVEASSHRAELVQRLDEVIGELDKGLEYLQRDTPDLRKEELQRRKGQYEKLRRVLKEIPEAPEIPTCMSPRLINLFDLLTPVDTRRISPNIRVCAPYAVSAVDCLEYSVVIPLPYTYHSSVRTLPPSFIAVIFPFTLLIAPQVVFMSSTGPTSRPLRLLVYGRLSKARHCRVLFIYFAICSATRVRLMTFSRVRNIPLHAWSRGSILRIRYVIFYHIKTGCQCLSRG